MSSSAAAEQTSASPLASPAAAKSRGLESTTGIDERLSTIMEDGQIPRATAELKASNRPHYRRWQLGSPPSFRFESPPPPYIDDIGPHGEKLSDVRNNKHIARRGGWKRLCIILLALTVVIVALAVGLTFGLKHSNGPSSNDSTRGASPAATTTPSDGPFPVGAYSMVTFLETVSTACTGNPATWLCYPYTTYNESSTKSAATYDWIITAVKPTETSSSNLTISSSNNPFALTFKDVPLEMLDRGLSTERYRFQVPMDKIVVPTVSITTDNSRATCWFNGTTFQAQLYTKRAKVYPPTDAPQQMATGGMKAWPFAIEVKQVIGGGQDIPECYKVRDGITGSRIMDNLAPMSASGTCSCQYKNYGV